MNKQNTTVMKLAETALLAALCYVSFTFLQIKIPVPGGDATSLHIGNTFCVLGALLLGGWYGGLAGAIGMTIADLMDPVYITGAPKTFVLKLCIGLITGLVAHKLAKINETISDILHHTTETQHRFFDKRKYLQERKVGYVVITGDKGLAGAYNHNILRLTEERLAQTDHPVLFLVGQVGRSYFAGRDVSVVKDFL